MDHLSVPTNSVFFEPIIPFLGQRYDGRPFIDYPNRCGVTELSLLKPRNSRIASKLAPFLQAWLFLGLFEEIFGVSSERLIKRHQFENGEQKDIITTSGLHDVRNLRLEIIFRVKADNPSKFVTLVKGYKRCIDEANYRLFSMHQLFVDHLTKEVYTSFHMLLQFATNTVRYANNFRLMSLQSLDRRRVDEPFVERMRVKGWCPTLIKLVRLVGDIDAVYYISNMKLVILDDHSSCTKYKCINNQINTDYYMPLHVTDRCANPNLCIHWHSPQKEMVSILEAGSIPLIINDEVNHKKLRMRLIGSEEKTRYVALSHVWSQGKGNPKSNSLPLCQLLLISEKVNALYTDDDTPVPFWIDTLCCPIGPPLAQALALERMAITYKNADKVLVIDSSLDSVLLPGEEPGQESFAEALLRIFATPWLRRLWTLQEGLLAKQLYFQFSNGALDFGYAHAKAFSAYFYVQDKKVEISEGRFPCRYSSFTISLCTGIFHYLLFVSQNLSTTILQGNIILEKIAFALQHRSTSVAEDEAVCVGTLLNMDVSRILKVPSSKRMVQVWNIIDERGELKQTPLFHEGPKHDIIGYRWAPVTFLDRRYLSTADCPTAKLTENGLLFDCPGFILQYHFYDSLDDFTFKSFGVWRYRCTRIKSCKYDCSNSNLNNFMEERHISTSSSTYFAILIRTDFLDVPESGLEDSSYPKMDVRSSRFDEDIFHEISGVRGALVSIERVHEGVCYVRLHSHVTISRTKELLLTTDECSNMSFDERLHSWLAGDLTKLGMEDELHDRPYRKNNFQDLNSRWFERETWCCD